MSILQIADFLPKPIILVAPFFYCVKKLFRPWLQIFLIQFENFLEWRGWAASQAAGGQSPSKFIFQTPPNSPSNTRLDISVLKIFQFALFRYFLFLGSKLNFGFRGSGKCSKFLISGSGFVIQEFWDRVRKWRISGLWRWVVLQSSPFNSTIFCIFWG